MQHATTHQADAHAQAQQEGQGQEAAAAAVVEFVGRREATPTTRESYEDAPRTWGNDERAQNIEQQRASGALQQLKDQALDDLSSDDEDAGNATGRVPTHWYEGYMTTSGTMSAVQ